MPSAGSYYNKGVRANLLLYVLLRVKSLIKTLVVTHSMEQSPSGEAKQYSVNQEIPRI
jgi:hypothetical protein